jgi:hypothetical protein
LVFTIQPKRCLLCTASDIHNLLRDAFDVHDLLRDTSDVQDIALELVDDELHQDLVTGTVLPDIDAVVAVLVSACDLASCKFLSFQKLLKLHYHVSRLSIWGYMIQ